MKKSLAKTIDASRDHTVFFGILKGSLIALTISLLGVLIFAFVLRFVPLADSVISPVNQVIKGISILIGTLIGLKKTKEMGLVSGLLIGFLYTALAFVTFSILDGGFHFSTTLLNDLLFGSIIGAICGIIAVNIRRKNA